MKHEGVRNVMFSHVYAFKSTMINQMGSWPQVQTKQSKIKMYLKTY